MFVLSNNLSNLARIRAENLGKIFFTGVLYWNSYTLFVCKSFMNKFQMKTRGWYFWWKKKKKLTIFCKNTERIIASRVAPLKKMNCQSPTYGKWSIQMNTDGIPTSYVNMSKDYYYGSREKKKKLMKFL